MYIYSIFQPPMSRGPGNFVQDRVLAQGWARP